jgi:Zn-finger nucleic acid-binding protein
MKRIYGSGETDLAIDIDKCPNCGGFWFDNQELFLISSEDAKKYDSEIIRQEIPKSASHDRICPNCQLPLVLLKDPELSKRMQVDICPKCLGLWLDQGEFLRYKEFQKEKIEKAKKEDAVQAVEILQKQHQTEGAGRFWRFLMQDVDQPYESTKETGGFGSNLESILMWLIRSVLSGLRR